MIHRMLRVWSGLTETKSIVDNLISAAQKAVDILATQKAVDILATAAKPAPGRYVGDPEA